MTDNLSTDKLFDFSSLPKFDVVVVEVEVDTG